MKTLKIFFVGIASLVLIGIGAVAAKIHSRLRLQTILEAQQCDDVPCAHRNVRLMAIESVINQRGYAPSYLMIGDSITEFADLPEICGRKPINAGIGFATTKTFLAEGRRLAELAKPDFIIIALGINDAFDGRAEGFRERLGATLASLRPWKIVLVPATLSAQRQDTDKINSVINAIPYPQAQKLEGIETIDGIHLSASSYVAWKESIVGAASASVCE